MTVDALRRIAASNHFQTYAAKQTLKHNQKSSSFSNLVSLLLLFAPAVGFGVLLLGIHLEIISVPSNLLKNLSVEFYIIILFGVIATIGGVCDWVFHRLYVASGPNEHKSHLLALGTGGVPLFVLMAWASVTPEPGKFLIPIIVILLYTTTLICYDEFQFHLKRCRPLETLFHRMLVFGNGIAFLAWLHWIYV